jgi:hypothetical protein
MEPNLPRIYELCLEAIGGDANEDVIYVREARARSVDRDNFFTQAVWAILVAGIARKSAESFCLRAKEAGCDRDFRTIAGWTDRNWQGFLGRLYPDGITDRGGKKWAAIRRIASELAACPDEESFRAEFFAGKARSADLDEDDVRRLAQQSLPFIGYVNAQYVVRNMGGEAITCDRLTSTPGKPGAM